TQSKESKESFFCIAMLKHPLQYFYAETSPSGRKSFKIRFLHCVWHDTSCIQGVKMSLFDSFRPFLSCHVVLLAICDSVSLSEKYTSVLREVGKRPDHFPQRCSKKMICR